MNKDQTVMNTVVTVSRKLWQAMQAQDIAGLKRYLHENAMFVHMGVTLSCEDELEVIRQQKIIYKHVELEETTCQQMESTIILLNKLKLTAIVNDKEVIHPFVVTEVYTQNQDQIKLASLSYTRINY